MANSGLCEQSVLARSLELERSTSGASEMLPGIADRFRAAGESANAAVNARDTNLDALADGLTWLLGSGAPVDSSASDRQSGSVERLKKQPHLIQIWIAVDVTFYP
jgi:hypothetical protein